MKNRQGQQSEAVVPNVLIFPLPLQGPINSMLKLAELLCLAGIRVTFLNTVHNHRRLLRHSPAPRRLSRRYGPAFRLESFPDGLPEGHIRSGDKILDLFTSVAAAAKPLLRHILTAPAADDAPPFTACIASDGIFGFAAEVAEEVGVPIIYFDTISPCSFWTYLCLPNLIHSGEFPFSDDDLDVPIRSVPGMESFLRRRDLPSYCRAGADDPIIQLILEEDGLIHKARGVILDTFEELEAPTELLSHMRGVVPNLYAVGPLHSLLKTRLPPPGTTAAREKLSANLWEEDGGCIAWLDAQPARSVVYVSIGSQAVMTAAQGFEFWHGLVSSGQRFLWVRRPGSIAGGEENLQIPAEVADGTKERGHIVGWAPQEEVLAHAAVGAFLTHAGWNSTLESVVAGVPMACWPCFVDQHVNSRHVSEVWALGVDMKDTCDRDIVASTLRDLMGPKREAFVQSAKRMARMARKSVGPGGSSSSSLDRLIGDINSMALEALHA